MDKVSAELVTLTYGSIVAQLCKDYEYDYLEVNKQLEKMGYNIGVRLIEDFLAKSSAPSCTNFREVAEMISKVICPAVNEIMARLTLAMQVGFKIFLNITPTITNWSSDNKQFSLVFEEKSSRRLCRAPRRRESAGRAMVFEHSSWCASWRPRNGTFSPDSERLTMFVHLKLRLF